MRRPAFLLVLPRKELVTGEGEVSKNHSGGRVLKRYGPRHFPTSAGLQFYKIALFSIIFIFTSNRPILAPGKSFLGEGLFGGVFG